MAQTLDALVQEWLSVDQVRNNKQLSLSFGNPFFLFCLE